MANALLSTRNQHPIASFDDTTDQDAIFAERMPSWYSGSGVEINVHFSMASATSGKVRWKAAFERVPDSGLDIDADDFADANYRDCEVPGTSGHVRIRAIRFTDGADMDSVDAGDQFRLKITRGATDDTATGDAELHAVEIRET